VATMLLILEITRKSLFVTNDLDCDPSIRHHRTRALALQLRFLKGSESMGNHDSNIVDACCVD
jgi:hypothetical protein